tara:strand:- start:176 stop:820 length:645 start_codon:yes stop_codon:yes gene_type:complete
MNNDSLYNFNNKSDESESLKLNMDELYIKKQQQDLNIVNNYNKILTRIHNKIKYISKQLINDQCCWYIMPEMMIGIPKYDYKDCTAYVIEKLRDNGFIVRYTHPNLLFISWKHWIPTYVRNEIKKKTGKNIDEYGNIVDNNSNNSNNSNNLNNFNNSIQSQSNNTNSYDNIIINKSENSSNSKNKDYKDIKTYKPSGSLIYNNNLLKKLDINDL